MTDQELKDSWYFGAQPKSESEERHHIISDSAILNANNYNQDVFNRGSAPSLPMDNDDHRRLQSTGRSKKADAIQTEQMNLLNKLDPMGAFERGVQEVKDEGLYEKYERKINILREEFRKWLKEPGKEYLTKPSEESPKQHNFNIHPKVKKDIYRPKQQNLSKAQIFQPSGIQLGSGLAKPILIIAGIVLLILVLLLLLRNFNFSSSKEPKRPPQVVLDPPTPPALTIFTEKTEMLFIANSPDLLSASSKWLDEVANELSKYIEQDPNAIFQVIGYVAIVPGPPDSTELSMARATNVIKELSVRGIKSDNLRPVAGGETDRWGNNIDELNRAPNRRILIQEEK
jgi:outer membrane protein OmpA-like peptidoglycan-associated protein